MKKAWQVLLAIVLVLGFTVLGCGGNGNGKDPGDGTGQGEPKTVELGNFTVSINDTQKGWASNGTDSLTTTLDIADLKAAKYLVLELSGAPTGGLKMIWLGDANSWSWTDTDGVLGDTGTPDASKGATLSDNVLKIELSKALKDYNKLAASTQVKLFIEYSSPDIAGLGITKAYLICE